MTDHLLPRVQITSGNDIPGHWGALRAAMHKGTVAIREPKGRESFATAWGMLTDTAGLDVVVVQDSGEEYPVKKSVLPKSTGRQVLGGITGKPSAAWCRCRWG